MQVLNSSRHGPRLGALLFLGVTAFATVRALAEPTGDPNVPKIVVSYADLNLETNEGAQTLLKRIDAAANSVCHESEVRSTRDLNGFARYRKCHRTAVARAVSDVSSPKLVALLRQ